MAKKQITTMEWLREVRNKAYKDYQKDPLNSLKNIERAAERWRERVAEYEKKKRKAA